VQTGSVTGRLLVVSGPPGAGKSTVAELLSRGEERSALVQGDAFFGFLANGAIDPWLPESNAQNETVTTVAAGAAGAFALAGYFTVYEGVVGPWFLPEFAGATGVGGLDYVVLLPSVETCVHRVATRTGHGFTDEDATRHMHAQFAGELPPRRHVIEDPPDDVDAVAALIRRAVEDGSLAYKLPADGRSAVVDASGLDGRAST